MSIPTISRSRDLLASLIASLPLRHYAEVWTGEELEQLPVEPRAWMIQPEARVPRAHTLAWTFDDMLFHGRAYWYVSERYADGYPARFQRLPAAMVNLEAPLFAGNVPIGDYSLTFNGTPVPNRDVVLFYSSVDPLLAVGHRAILTAERLDLAALRFASTPAAFGWLKQVGGEPLSGDELADIAAGWEEARDANAVAALNEFVDWHESSMDPSRLQLVEARAHQALELARIADVPPYLVGAPAGTGMTYQNAQQAASDAVTFGALPYLEVIEQTLSGPQVLPRGRIVRLDRAAWLANPLNAAAPVPAPEAAPA